MGKRFNAQKRVEWWLVTAMTVIFDTGEHVNGRHALFVGDVTIDLTMTTSHIPAPDEKVHVMSAIEAVGGVIANAAVACARTNARVKAIFQVGGDASEIRIRDEMRSRGVDAVLAPASGTTSRVVILIEPHGEKRLLLYPGVSLYPCEAAIAAIDLSRTAWVHTAVYGPAAQLLVTKCRNENVPWSLDLEPASFPDGIDTIASMIAGAAVVFCNDRAAAAIEGDAATSLMKRGAKAVVRSRGSKGAEYISACGAHGALPPKLGRVIDTTGAGDCLAGWFIGEILNGQPISAALRSAVTAASLSCQALGAQASYPTKAQVSECLAEAKSTCLESEET